MAKKKNYDLLYNFVDEKNVEGDEIAREMIEGKGYSLTYDELYNFVDEKMVEGDEYAIKLLQEINPSEKESSENETAKDLQDAYEKGILIKNDPSKVRDGGWVWRTKAEKDTVPKVFVQKVSIKRQIEELPYYNTPKGASEKAKLFDAYYSGTAKYGVFKFRKLEDAIVHAEKAWLEKDYDDGGAIDADDEEFKEGGQPTADDVQNELGLKSSQIAMHLPFELSIYIPSTKEASVPVGDVEFATRVDEVKKYLSGLFGGFTSSQSAGGYMSKNGQLIQEKVEKVTSFSSKESFDENKGKLLAKIAEWAREWSQESIGLEFEGDLYYVTETQEMKTGGAVTTTEEYKILGYIVTEGDSVFGVGRDEIIKYTPSQIQSIVYELPPELDSYSKLVYKVNNNSFFNALTGVTDMNGEIKWLDKRMKGIDPVFEAVPEIRPQYNAYLKMLKFKKKNPKAIFGEARHWEKKAEGGEIKIINSKKGYYLSELEGAGFVINQIGFYTIKADDHTLCRINFLDSRYYLK